MPVLEHRQYELSGLVFGEGTPLIVTGRDLGDAEWDVQDADNPTGDGSRMGRDFLRGPTWAFDFNTDGSDDEEAAAMLASLTGAWRSGDRSKPGTVFELRYCLAGRTRIVYGRPRRFAPVDGGAVFDQGSASATADFKLTDPLHYDATERSTRVDIGIAAQSGWKFPMKFPLTTTPSGSRDGFIDVVGGDTPAPVVIDIYGPVTNPWVSSQGWRLDLATSLTSGQSLTIDTRPWANTVIRSDGASLGGALTRTSRLSDARLQPGAATLTFGGHASTNSAYAVVRWRSTYVSL